MTKKSDCLRPAKGKNLMERLVPVLEMADKLSPINQDIDKKALSDWICGDDGPLIENMAAGSEAAKSMNVSQRM